MENFKRIENFIYKGNRYTIAVNKSEVVTAWDAEGYQIYNPGLLHNLEVAWNA